MGHWNDSDTPPAQFTDERRRSRVLVEERDHSDIVALSLLADGQGVDDSFEPTERSGSHEVENSQKNPASRRRKPLSESPFGIFNRGIA